jgi:hypothetical protein
VAGCAEVFMRYRDDVRVVRRSFRSVVEVMAERRLTVKTVYLVMAAIGRNM